MSDLSSYRTSSNMFYVGPFRYNFRSHYWGLPRLPILDQTSRDGSWLHHRPHRSGHSLHVYRDASQMQGNGLFCISQGQAQVWILPHKYHTWWGIIVTQLNWIIIDKILYWRQRCNFTHQCTPNGLCSLLCHMRCTIQRCQKITLWCGQGETIQQQDFMYTWIGLCCPSLSTFIFLQHFW